eukprot:19398-Heterococcus_DN1.PRE.2
MEATAAAHAVMASDVYISTCDSPTSTTGVSPSFETSTASSSSSSTTASALQQLRDSNKVVTAAFAALQRAGVTLHQQQHAHECFATGKLYSSLATAATTASSTATIDSTATASASAGNGSLAAVSIAVKTVLGVSDSAVGVGRQQ